MPKVLVAIVIAARRRGPSPASPLLFSGAVTRTCSAKSSLRPQAIVVGALAELQFIGLRQKRRRAGGGGIERLISSLRGQSEAIQSAIVAAGLLRRVAPRNDEKTRET